MKGYVYSMGVVTLLAVCMPAMAFQASGNLLDNPDIILGKGYFAGGYTVATGDAANFVDNGWNLGFGGQWQLGTGPVWLRLDFEYSCLTAVSAVVGNRSSCSRACSRHRRHADVMPNRR